MVEVPPEFTRGQKKDGGSRRHTGRRVGASLFSNFKPSACVVFLSPFTSSCRKDRLLPKKKKISHSCNTYCKGPQTKHPTCGYITTGSPTADIMIYKYPENDAKLFSMFLYKERPSDYLHHFNSF